ncbi:MAG: peptide ABC transporter substrate-binding protein [Crocinitomicaceae bacterium]|nr:peptide ABC transporter substrate-binding protein [Crocinitomicaceae bacterium]
MKTLGLFILSCLLLVSCSEEEKQQFEHAGGTVTMALENEPSTYILREVRDYYSATVLSQIHEGLVAFDPKTVKIVPKLASEWSKSDDGKSYTFTLRDDVYFHDNPVFKNKEDRLLTVEDVVKSFELGCTKSEDGGVPSSYTMTFEGLLKGADEFMEGTASSISGITVEGNNITLELLHEDHNLLNKLANVCMSIVSKKIVEANKETDVVGTGPFVYTTYIGGETPSLILTKNNDYYLQDEEGNALPYLDSLVFIYQSRKLEQLDMFETGKLDLIIGLPTSRITRMMEGRIQDFNSKPPKLILANNPLLESHFYYFNMTDERFLDPLVRQAFNYAVDKESIGRDILRNQYYDLGEYGVTPPISNALRGYDFASVKNVGYTYNPDLARQLLAEAGYPGGVGFGSVDLRYSIDDTHSAVADEFAKQIFKVLGINVNIDGSSFEQLNEDGANGNGDIFRMGWSADYPNPESFLMNFYGEYIPDDPLDASPTNKARYKNHLFDEFYKQATNSTKVADQMKLFSQAEVELMKDPPIIPLWYTGDIEITQSYVRDFHFNAINYFDFTKVYLKEWTAEEYQMMHSNQDSEE